MGATVSSTSLPRKILRCRSLRLRASSRPGLRESPPRRTESPAGSRSSTRPGRWATQCQRRRYEDWRALLWAAQGHGWLMWRATSVVGAGSSPSSAARGSASLSGLVLAPHFLLQPRLTAARPSVSTLARPGMVAPTQRCCLSWAAAAVVTMDVGAGGGEAFGADAGEAGDGGADPAVFLFMGGGGGGAGDEDVGAGGGDAAAALVVEEQPDREAGDDPREVEREAVRDELEDLYREMANVVMKIEAAVVARNTIVERAHRMKEWRTAAKDIKKRREEIETKVSIFTGMKRRAVALRLRQVELGDEPLPLPAYLDQDPAHLL